MMSNGYLEENLEFLKDVNNLKDNYCIIEDITIDNVTRAYTVVFSHISRQISLERVIRLDNDLSLPRININLFIETVKEELKSNLRQFNHQNPYSILIHILKKKSLHLIFSGIDSDLNEEVVEYITSNVRYYDIISSLDANAINGIIKNLERLSRLVVPVVELGLGLRCNNYDHLNDYLILDTLDCEIDSQLINDSQAMQLLELQRILEEYNVKENGISNILYDKIKYCIPAYFKVTFKSKQTRGQ